MSEESHVVQAVGTGPASVPMRAEDRQAATESEYGTYVAASAIDIDGARAFNTGDPVPVSHVERGVVPQELVAKITTKAGRAAAGISQEG